MRWLCLLAALLALTAPGAAQTTTPSPRARFLIIPFENPSKEIRYHWLGEASAVLLADDLNALGGLAFTREERLGAFAELQVPPVATLSRATVIRLGQVVGATHVVIGSFRLTGGEITVRAQTIRLDSGRLEQETLESGPLEDLFAVFARVSGRLLPSATRPTPAGRPGLPVFENYIKGLIATAPSVKVAHLESALKLDSGFDRARLALWQVHYDEGNGPLALLTAAAVSEASPLYGQARFRVALSLVQLKRLDDAFATLRALADRAPAAALFNNIGVVQMRRPATAQAGRASSYFSQAVKLDESDPDYCFNLGYAFWAEKDVPSAIHWLREAVRRDPADGEAHAVLAAALQATGAVVEAARERELATQLSSLYAEWAKTPATGGLRGEPVPRGLERLKLSLETSELRRVTSTIATTGQRDQQQLAAFHLDRGRRFFEQGNNSEAAAELKRAIYLAPYEAEAHLLLGRIYLRTGQVPAAIDAFKIALWSQETAVGRIALAQAYLQVKDEAAARQALERALALDPASTEAKELLTKIQP